MDKKEYSRLYREKNKERLKEQRVRYKDKNEEYQRRYREKHREEINARQRERNKMLSEKRKVEIELNPIVKVRKKKDKKQVENKVKIPESVKYGYYKLKSKQLRKDAMIYGEVVEYKVGKVPFFEITTDNLEKTLDSIIFKRGIITTGLNTNSNIYKDDE